MESGMRITVVRPTELGAPELARWRGFQRAVPSLVHPFLSPEFAVVVGRHRPEARVAVLSDGTEIVGFFPFERRRFGYGVPIAAGLTSYQGLIHAPDLEWDPRELLRACDLAVWEFDCLVDGQKPFEPYQAIRVPSPIMDLSGGYETYKAQLRENSSSLLKGLAYKRRKLERKAGALRFVLDSHDHEDLRMLMAWKSEQYLRTGRRDRFAWAGTAGIIEEMLDIRTDGFGPVLAMLYVGDEPVASQYMLRADHVAVDWFPGYNTHYGQFSPGMLIRLDVAEAAHAAGIHHIHMARGTRDRYKQLFKSRDLYVAEGRVVRRTPAAATIWLMRAPARRVRYVITENPKLREAADRTLHRYGHLRSALRERTERRRKPPIG
nr:putative polysaccharide biosynthesis protein CelD [uncultured bacterium]